MHGRRVARTERRSDRIAGQRQVDDERPFRLERLLGIILN
jgi:hypothetical protein